MGQTRRVESSHWVIDYSLPPTAERRWRSNKSQDVLAATAERVIEVWREEEPDGVIHVVRRVGSHASILIDE